MNMCRIMDPKTNRVVVLDKVKVHGWEGLTFPGGKVEPFESFYESTAREVYEETGLVISNLKLSGVVQWIHKKENLREVGFLYTTVDFEGELLEKTAEGQLYWMDYSDFSKREDKSYSMNEILKVYDAPEYSEVAYEFWEGELTELRFF